MYGAIYDSELERPVSSSHHRFTAEIQGAPALLFDLLADMPNYGRWLPGSAAFGATTEVSPYPVRLGTTYLDAGPMGGRPGRVTAYEPPRYIAFHQTMALKGPLRVKFDIHASYTIEALERATRVTRDLDLAIDTAAILKIALPLIVYAFRKENSRTLVALKRHVEA
jgi:hypothetical protein